LPTSGLKLLTFPGDFRAFKCLVAAEFNGLKVETDKDFVAGKSNKTKEFKAMSPLEKTPLLVTPQGPLLESNAIARHLARHRNDTQLFGASFFDHALVDSWMDWCSNELEIPVTMWIYPIFGFMPPNPKAIGKAKQDTKAALKVLEAHLLSRSFMVGRGITLADITLACALVYPMKMVFDAKFRANFPSVTRWFMTCVAMKEFSVVCNEVNLCQTEMQPPKSAGKKGKKKGGKAAKKQEKKKATPKPKKKKPARVRHPLDAMEKSPFVMDVWKKKYSNSKKDYTKAIDYFWANFDRKGYSVWKAAFKHQKENQVDWLTSNKIGGYTQRLDSVRKWVFGVMCVIDRQATDQCFHAEGYFITRGQDIKFIMDSSEESETYNWTKVLGNDVEMTDLQKSEWSDMLCTMKLSKEGVDISDSLIFK